MNKYFIYDGKEYESKSNRDKWISFWIGVIIGVISSIILIILI